MITVFLADDHAVVRDGLRFLLEAQDEIKVVGDAADGHETVRQVATLCPHIVLIDIGMPRLNGIEATQQICRACPDTQVIILSIHASRVHISRALGAGARGYVLKESAGREVIEAVRAVQAGHRYLSKKIADRVIEDYAERSTEDEANSPLASLTSREREVLQLVVEGKSSSEIATILSLSPKTVETYRSRLMHRLEIDDLPTLVRFAIRHGIIPLE
jgi:DNA-binding NarL/FixJ family response regulator